MNSNTKREVLRKGDLVQINPAVDTFGGSFMVVHEVNDWGVMGYGQNAGQSGQWYLRVKWDDLEITGGCAVWEVQ